jgi:hypothetical protein
MKTFFIILIACAILVILTLIIKGISSDKETIKQKQTYATEISSATMPKVVENIPKSGTKGQISDDIAVEEFIRIARRELEKCDVSIQRRHPTTTFDGAFVIVEFKPPVNTLGGSFIIKINKETKIVEDVKIWR